MSWSTVNFGKHSGKTLPQIILSDPDWFFWAVERGLFKQSALRQEADDVNRKSRCIRIPQKGGKKLVAEYFIHRPTNKFSHFDLAPEDRPAHQGSSPTFRAEVIDLSVPRRIASYDKLGFKNMLTSLRFHVFGSESARLTRKICEDFFDNDANFCL
jgi:hypothetical protein